MNKRFFSRKKQLLLFQWILIPLVLLHLGLGFTASIRNCTIKSGQFAAILISDKIFNHSQPWLTRLIYFTAYPYWTTYFNNRGMNVRWVLHARGYHLENFIVNPYYQSILLVGDGSSSNWQASDRGITPQDVAIMSMGAPRKQGEWLQIANLDPTQTAMGHLVMNDQHVYSYDKPSNPGIVIADTLFGFHTLKSAQ